MKTIRERILKLKDMPEKWFKELSINVVDPVEFDWAADLFNKYPEELAKPSHIVRWGSGIALEWQLHTLYPSIEINLLTKKAELEAFKKPKYVGEDSDQFDLRDPAEWERMIQKLTEILNKE